MPVKLRHYLIIPPEDCLSVVCLATATKGVIGFLSISQAFDTSIRLVLKPLISDLKINGFNTCLCWSQYPSCE